MTKEEAIEFGKMWLDVNEDSKHSRTYEFFELAIQALEQDSNIGKVISMRDATPEEQKSVENYIKSISKPTGVDFETLEQESCKDAVSRQAVIDSIKNYFHDEYYQRTSIQDCRDCLIEDVIKALPPVTPQPKMGRCKDCKWWKDSDGAYRRGVGAESRCPINHEEVYMGNGYCYMFEPLAESKDKEK